MHISGQTPIVYAKIFDFLLCTRTVAISQEIWEFFKNFQI